MKYKLDADELKIEKNIDKYRPVIPGEKKRISRIIERAAKKRVITLRVNDNDLVKIKDLALHEGLPYQTLISSVLHKYADNRLCDREEAKRIAGMTK